MGDAHGTTLSFHEDGKSGRVGPKPEPVLVLVLECGRPRAGSVRYRLGELTGVALGRGPERRAELSGNELTVRVPDKWMSSRHARIEPSMRGDEQKMMAAGCDAYLSKPISVTTFLETIRKFIG